MGRLYNNINFPASWPYTPLEVYTPGHSTALDDFETRQTQVRERVPGSPSYQSSGYQGGSERMFNFSWGANSPDIAFQAIKDFRGYSTVRSIVDDDGLTNTPISITGAVWVSYGSGLTPNIFHFDATNDFVAGETIIISGITSPTSLNGAHTVYSATGAGFNIYSSATNPADPGQGGWNFAGATVKRHPNYIHRVLPHTNPSIPGYLYCSNVRIEPDVPLGTDSNGVACPDEGVARVTYSSPMYRLLTDKQMKQIQGSVAPNESSLLRYCIIQLDPQAKFQTIPAMAAFKWQTAPQTPVAQTAYVLLAEGDLTIQWLEVPYTAYPRTAISRCLGKSNAYDLGHASSFYGTFGKGTLVMQVPKVENIRMANGLFGFNITYRFKYFPQGANALFRMPVDSTTAPGFDFISTRTTGNVNGAMPFPAADFNQLFCPEP